MGIYSNYCNHLVYWHNSYIVYSFIHNLIYLYNFSFIVLYLNLYYNNLLYVFMASLSCFSKTFNEVLE